LRGVGVLFGDLEESSKKNAIFYDTIMEMFIFTEVIEIEQMLEGATCMPFNAGDHVQQRYLV